MEFKGTKGKWVAKNLFNNWLIVDEDTDCVLEIRDNEANAKLIASAPELLEALQDLVIAIESEKVILAEEYKNAIKAIKKAL